MNDSKLTQLARMISDWPGLVSGMPGELIEDSLVLLDHLGDARSLVDVGSGGGLPGLPLQIVRPDLKVTLIEADQAKAAFLVRACAELESVQPARSTARWSGTVVVVRKARSTPPAYPRRPGVPARRPL